jgi:hypothetical protein
MVSGGAAEQIAGNMIERKNSNLQPREHTSTSQTETGALTGAAKA